MWTSEKKHTTTAGPTAVWHRWVDPECWSEHDSRERRAEFQGPLAVGSTIMITPAGGAASVAEIVELQPERHFATVSRMPGCTLRVVQRIEEHQSSTVLRHRIELSGLSAPLFRRLFVESMAAGIPDVLATLARLAEADERVSKEG